MIVGGGDFTGDFISPTFQAAEAAAELASTYELRGSVHDLTGLVIEGNGPFVPLGSHVTIYSGVDQIPAQVVGFRRDKVLIMPYSDPQGIAPGATIIAQGAHSQVLVSDKLLGRVLDGLGNPIDNQPLPLTGHLVPLYRDPPSPVMRARIKEPFDVGVRVLNSMLTVGQGQRIGIMAGSGVGKSTLLGMIARHSSSDVNVIALVGERGREVREFIERDLGPEGLARSVLVVATGNDSALLRIRAAFLATAIAEHFRDSGKRVVLMLDSLTRLAMAQREIGLAVGEPPSTRGYTPSVFAMLPRLLERAGTSVGEGAITGIYTVLVEGDDMNEPIADATRGILDGHVVLSRNLAGKGHFPAIEVLESISRVMADIVPGDLLARTQVIRDLLATYKEAEDLILIGAYKPGQNAKVDAAVQMMDRLNTFLRQPPHEKCTLEQSWQAIAELFENKEKAASPDKKGAK